LSGRAPYPPQAETLSGTAAKRYATRMNAYDAVVTVVVVVAVVAGGGAMKRR
jgi:hypothetical protein